MWIKRLIQTALILTFGVILLGSYTRLTDAGLGCPDWPGCYGQLIAPEASNALAAKAFPDAPIEPTKAWTEMIHRYFAGSLGLLIALIFFSNLKQKVLPQALTALLMGVVIFQAALGMWTVTLKLLPLVVMGHLLGGFSTLTLLWVLYLKLCRHQPWIVPHRALVFLSIVAWFILVAQLILGGWTSANYAALICPDFPYCQGQWLPNFEWKAFNPLAGFGMPNPLEAFGAAERTSIHMMHRIGALISALLIGSLCWALKKRSIGLASLLALQILLGISNVVFSLPLPIAVLHTGIGVLLLLALTTAVVRLQYKARS